MDRFVTTTKRGGASGGKVKEEEKPKRFSPYDADERPAAKRKKFTIEGADKMTHSQLTKRLLSTLSEETNPITHSDAYERAEHIVSLSTGHQVSNGGFKRTATGRREYLQDRTEKLALQKSEAAPTESQLLRGVRIYLNGYLRGTTDIEMKRIAARAGATTLPTPSGATHIVTSMPLSGSKTQKFLTKKSRTPIQVVKPEWVTESIAAGKRLPEHRYAIIEDKTTKTMFDFAVKK